MRSPHPNPLPAGRGDEEAKGEGIRATLAVCLVLGLAVWPLLSVYPYYLAYYNPLLGGGPLAQRALFVGWGEGMDRVAAYLNDRPLVLEAPTAATAYHRVLQAYLRENGAMPLERAELADYIVPYANSIQRDQKSDILASYLDGQEPEFVVWLSGIEYARVYRGPHYPTDRAIGAAFERGARLESVVFAPGSGQVRSGDDLLVRLRWWVPGDGDGLRAALRLVGADGRVALQERWALNRALREGDLLVVDSRLTLPNNVPPGDYRLQAGLEDTAGLVLNVADGSAAVTLQSFLIQAATTR